MRASGIEVSGYVVKSYLDAFKIVRHVPHNILAKHQVGAISPSGEFVYDSSSFFPFERVLAAVTELANAVGAKKMFEVGLEVPKNAVLPPGASEIRTAMQVLDGGYHLNHRKNGRPMFDPGARSMQEGIGHYKCGAIKDRDITMEVDAPYPCEMDRGLMQAWARRFEPTALCTHLEPKTCRNLGAASCRYSITWR